MWFQNKLDAFKAEFKGGKAPYFAPPEIHPVMERATAELTYRILVSSQTLKVALKGGAIGDKWAITRARAGSTPAVARPDLHRAA